MSGASSLPEGAPFARPALRVGLGVTVLAHLTAIVWASLAERAEAHVSPPRKDKAMCTPAVGGPGCAGETCGGGVVGGDAVTLNNRRCPAPMRRRPRREAEVPPTVEVDLLQAQLVPALGISPDKAKNPRMAPGVGGTTRDSGAPTKAPGPVPRQIPQSILGKQGRLGAILGGPGLSTKSKKLGQIVGTSDGSATGFGATARNGSEYVALVQIELQQKFVVPPQVPEWELPHRWARVRITRMAADGTVLAWTLMRPSGLPLFDRAVETLLNRYKSARERFPVPPAEVLDAINARGMVVDLLGRLR